MNSCLTYNKLVTCYNIIDVFQKERIEIFCGLCKIHAPEKCDAFRTHIENLGNLTFIMPKMVIQYVHRV